jgi:hypothetical protein
LVDRLAVPHHNDRVISVPFDRVQHLVRIDVGVDGERTRFLVDTGIGITVVSSAFVARFGLTATGETFAARRMSGQVVAVPLVQLPALRIGDLVVPPHVAGIADLGAEDGPAGFHGLLGPGAFTEYVVTTDAAARMLTFTPRSDFAADGRVVPLDVHRDGPSYDPFASLVLPSGRTVSVEVDTGSPDLILDTRFMEDCGVEPDDPGVETTTGVDETGHEWTRRFVTIDGSVTLAAAPDTAQERPRVQFQDIVHDGLVGTAYLERFRFSFDVTGQRLVLGERVG